MDIMGIMDRLAIRAPHRNPMMDAVLDTALVSAHFKRFIDHKILLFEHLV